ncbi:MAG: rod shape-determining protein MreC [Magnetococcales bacterium]|nr:rod shape-determining protein MreC [Magnetococcales bacterium]
MVELFALFKHYRNGIVAFLVLTVAIVLMLSLHSSEFDRNDVVSGRILDVVGPVQRLVLAPLVTYRQIQTRISELKQLDLDNRKMQAELQKLRPLGSRLEELKQENERLHKLLKIPFDPDYHRMSARVVGDSSSAFARSLIINAGKAEGVFVNAIVVVPEGVLGRVVMVGPHTSLVITLLDLNSRVPVLVQRSRVRGIAAGFNSRKLHMEFVSHEADVKVDDLIVTSGTGEGFPKGLVVGRVEKVGSGSSGLFKKLVVKPAVDFDHIENVAIFMVPSRYSVDKSFDWDSGLAEEP